jgi:uncharacterized coiled-coil DUF342 family protein
MEQLKNDIRELFKRVGTLEGNVGVLKESKDNILEKVKELKDLFATHNENENVKFEEFSTTQKQILKFIYIGMGVGITIQIVVMPLVLYIILGK